jgi:hypothetical protein
MVRRNGAQTFYEAADDVVMLRLGVELETAGDFANFDAAIFAGVAGDQLVERGLYGQLFVA